MTIKAGNAIFTPRTYGDAIDSLDVSNGICSELTNLIPHPSNKNFWIPRPAARLLTDFTGFSDPDFISGMLVVGRRVYGMIASSTNFGQDEPFCYDIPAGAFISISGITAGNTPDSPSDTGEWVPPTLSFYGGYIVVTHPGFDGLGSNFFGLINISNPASPVWSAANTTVNPLPAVPTCAAVFNGRVHFAVANADYVTDALAFSITNAYQILTFNDNNSITAFAPLPLTSQVTGGIIGGLVVFKGLAAPYQIKGDFTSNDLTVDGFNYAVGTDSPLGISNTPAGLGVCAVDGLRILGFDATFQTPTGLAGEGMNVPLLHSLEPTRVASACNASVLRIALQNGNKADVPFEEYWYHISRQVWSGPHTLVSSLIQPYLNSFIVAPIGVPGALYISETVPSSVSDYTEFGDQLNWTMTTNFLPESPGMSVSNFNEMVVLMQTDAAMDHWTAYATDASDNQYDSVTYAISGTASYWDAAIWDADSWDSGTTGLRYRLIEWTQPIVTQRAQISITGGAAGGVIVGRLKYDQESYVYTPTDGV